MRQFAVGASVILLATGLAAQAVVNYQKPAPAILKVMDAPRPPRVMVSPTRDYLLLVDAVPNPSIADLAEPMLRIAGLRIDPASNGLHATPRVRDLRLERIRDGAVTPVAAPAVLTHMTAPEWSPDGAHFAFTNVTRHGIELWMGDTATGRVHQVSGLRLDPVTGAAFQ
ncbi:MAG: hypothetical protein ACRD1L_12845, partial [Terriglobales bacterium]